MRVPTTFGTVVRQRRGRFYINLPGTLADQLKQEDGIAMRRDMEHSIVGYSEIHYLQLALRLAEVVEEHEMLWPQALMERHDAYDLLMNNVTMHVPIVGKQRVWLPRQLAPEKTCAAVVTVGGEGERFSIDYLV